MALAITDATFEEVVLKSDKPVVVILGNSVVHVEWWALLSTKFLQNMKEETVVGKVDVDANQEFAAKYGVRNIPTVLVFQNGEVVKDKLVLHLKTYTDAIDALL